MKTNCNIVNDLLPSYAEGLTSIESNALVEDHLQDCKDCRILLESLNDAQAELAPYVDDIHPLKKIRRRNMSLMAALCVVSLLLIIAIFVPAWIVSREDSARRFFKNNPTEIHAIVATDCVTREKLVLPFTYKQGIVFDDGALFYDETRFYSKETAEMLADRISSHSTQGWEIELIENESILLKLGSSRYRMHQVNGYWYNWVFEGLSVRFAVSGGVAYYYQFPIYLCLDNDTAIDDFNNSSSTLYSRADVAEFVEFYVDTGFYEIQIEKDAIVLLGYAKPPLMDDEAAYATMFPLVIKFEEEVEGVIEIAINPGSH